MNYFKEYLAYLKDNPEGYWFKRKLYGWGWTPATTEGWVVIFVFIGLLIGNGIYFANTPMPTSGVLLWFFARTLVLVALVIVICYKKGEKPKWQWGPTEPK